VCEVGSPAGWIRTLAHLEVIVHDVRNNFTALIPTKRCSLVDLVQMRPS
jgi:hypothetical protein